MPEASSLALSGCAALVTGASSGIGRAIALAVARAGADVAVTYRVNRDGAEAVAREIEALGRTAWVLPPNLADEPAIEQMGPTVRAALGRLDVWINNAGADILTGAGATLSTVQKLDLLLALGVPRQILAAVAGVDGAVR